LRAAPAAGCVPLAAPRSVHRVARQLRRDHPNGTYDKEVADSFPASDPPTGDSATAREVVPTATLEKKRGEEDYALEHGSS
jgi:hypothetical protein